MSTPDKIAAGFRSMAQEIADGVPLQRALRIAERATKQEAPVGTTGHLRRDITVRQETRNRGVVGNKAPYAKAVVQGTGIYGPKKARIVAAPGHAFFWKGAAHPVRSIKGQKPNPYPARALAKSRGEIERDLATYGLKLFQAAP